MCFILINLKHPRDPFTFHMIEQWVLSFPLPRILRRSMVAGVSRLALSLSLSLWPPVPEREQDPLAQPSAHQPPTLRPVAQAQISSTASFLAPLSLICVCLSDCLWFAGLHSALPARVDVAAGRPPYNQPKISHPPTYASISTHLPLSSILLVS